MARFVTIWFRHLKTDWHSIRQPALRDTAFVLASPDHGRLVITAINPIAQHQGIETGMVVSDARAIFPSIKILDDDPKLAERLLKSIAKWCIRYTDAIAIDLPNGLILDVSGCAHLWGGEKNYIKDINTRLTNRGYDVRATMADSIGSAWAIAHYGNTSPIIESGKQMETLLPLPPSALRLNPEPVDRLMKLGLCKISLFINMPRVALRRRFGPGLILRLDQALGNEEEPIKTVQPIEPFRERLLCLEPIVTATGIEIALERLLDTVCLKLMQEGKGIRKAVFSCYRVDNKIEKIEIGTSRATHNKKHLFKLFEEKIQSIEPALGIELFILEALKTEKLSPKQEKLWDSTSGLKAEAISELMDRLINRFGSAPIHRYMPDEHHWPERSFKPAVDLHESIESSWIVDRPRPINLLPKPEPIEVTAPIPDYPPMNFRYKGTLHKISKADGPERIEPEWWIAEGLHRDYYSVEDDEGGRYWLFRAGHYATEDPPRWYLHGFFA
jgi:Nucleotidyltransferase/DNA polymerase involved in DNA repair